jgi:hypothetical protein
MIAVRNQASPVVSVRRLWREGVRLGSNGLQAVAQIAHFGEPPSIAILLSLGELAEGVILGSNGL